MKTGKTLLLLFGMLSFAGCSMNDEDKLVKILSSEELCIQHNTYGGIGGYYESIYHLKQEKHETLLIIDERTDHQSFVRMNGKRELLNTFIQEAFNTHKPKKEMSASCLTGIDSEYIIKSGFTTLTLKPDKKCDSLFNLMLSDKCKQ